MFVIDNDNTPPVLAAVLQVAAGQKMALSLTVPRAYVNQHAPIGYIYAAGYGGLVEKVDYNGLTAVLTAYSKTGSKMLDYTRVNPTQSGTVSVSAWLEAVCDLINAGSSFLGDSVILAASAYTQGAAVGALLTTLQTISSCFGLDVFHVSTDNGDDFKFCHPGFFTSQSDLSGKLTQFDIQADLPDYDSCVLTRIAPVKQRDSVVVAPGRGNAVQYTVQQNPYMDGDCTFADGIDPAGLIAAVTCEDGYYRDEYYDIVFFRGNPLDDYDYNSVDGATRAAEHKYRDTCIVYNDQTQIHEYDRTVIKVNGSNAEVLQHDYTGYFLPFWMLTYNNNIEVYRADNAGVQTYDVTDFSGHRHNSTSINYECSYPYAYFIGGKSKQFDETAERYIDENGNVAGAVSQRKITRRINNLPNSQRSEFPWLPVMRDLFDVVYDAGTFNTADLESTYQTVAGYKVTPPKWDADFDDTLLPPTIDTRQIEVALDKSSSQWFDPTANPDRPGFAVPAPAAMANIKYNLSVKSDKIALKTGHKPGILTARWQDGSKIEKHAVYDDFDISTLSASSAVTCTLISSDQDCFTTADGSETGQIFTLTSDVWTTKQVALACVPYVLRQQCQNVKVDFVIPFALLAIDDAIDIVGKTSNINGFLVYITAVSVDFGTESYSFQGYAITG